MTRLLFWNTHRENVEDTLSRLVGNYRADVLILAESALDPRAVSRALSLACARTYWHCPGFCELVQLYADFPPENFRPVRESRRYTMQAVTLPSRRDMLLVAVHLGSKFYHDPDTQLMDSRDLAEEIRGAEAEVGHQRTVVVGDLNMNPFDKGVVAARALNAASSAEIACTGSRTLQGKDYPFFYNPMWGQLGDAGGRPPGSYYYRGSDDVCYYWNMLDQVLVRPDLVRYLDPTSVRILDNDGEKSLLTGSGPIRRPTPSDHLPLLFEFGL